jgi:parallel beta-helix repeat protein
MINDYPGNLQNWTWAKDQGICTGTGTINNPYLINDHFFNTRHIWDSSLYILNSRKYFRIENCLFNTSSNFAGIQLENTTNGYITKNRNLPDTGALVWLYNSSHNTVNNNNASNCHFYGILVDQLSYHNVISNNLVSDNLQRGIYVRFGADFNTIENNEVSSSVMGIYIDSSCDNNTIKGNHISDCTNEGVNLNTFATYNIIYLNCFMNNSVNAEDNGNHNIWDFGGKGNYWDNYNGTDANHDGIGDIPYNITGAALSQDHFPLMACPTPIIPSGVIPGYELYLIIGGILMSSMSVIWLTFKKKRLKI